MSYEIPTSIEPDIREYAKAEHITAEEAIVRLLREGLLAAGFAQQGASSPEPGKQILEVIQRARLARVAAEPISATRFFEEIQNTAGFETKEAAHEHLQELRDEWR